MIPTKQEVLKILEDARKVPKNRGWVAHSIAVGDAAGTIAEAINETGKLDKIVSKKKVSVPLGIIGDFSIELTKSNPALDVDKIIIMGYLHDVGKKVGPFQEHPYNGYKFMQDAGYDEDICEISLSHSFVNNDAFCMFSEFMQPERDKFVIDYIAKHKFTLEERIVSLCDMMVETEPWTLEKRIVDVILRHGTCEKTAERIKEAYKVKKYIDDLVGHNVYDLFPEIKDNL